MNWCGGAGCWKGTENDLVCENDIPKWGLVAFASGVELLRVATRLQKRHQRMGVKLHFWWIKRKRQTRRKLKREARKPMARFVMMINRMIKLPMISLEAFRIFLLSLFVFVWY